jgi:hypothetical protein
LCFTGAERKITKNVRFDFGQETKWEIQAHSRRTPLHRGRGHDGLVASPEIDMKKIPPVIIVCVLWIAFAASPILFSSPPLPTVFFFTDHPGLQMAGRALLVALLAAVTAGIWQYDPEPGRVKTIRYCGFALLAAFLTDLHFHTVDLFYMDWQIDQFGGILTHTYQPPDQYRFLPHGTLWWMALGNGDFKFSYLAYRFFFTFLLCHSIYRLARLYLSPQNSILIVFLYGAFYPLSTRYYHGNLLDPMSHLVMLTALYYCRLRQFWSFFWLFVLGVFIKETMLLLAPCYYLMNLETTGPREKHNRQQIVLLGLTGMAVFFACRLPFHFGYSFESLNRTAELMIYANLGMSRAQMWSKVSVFERYLHPVLFLFMWLPLILWQRRRLPVSLFWTSLYLAAGLYATNLCFGWNHESRNFIPGLVLLLISTMIILDGWVTEKTVRTINYIKHDSQAGEDSGETPARESMKTPLKKV